MLVGHTKFSPDCHFDTFKEVFCVSSVAEIAAIVDLLKPGVAISDLKMSKPEKKKRFSLDQTMVFI